MTSTTVVAVVGLGYVGLPLAVQFGTRYATIGFDVSTAKVAAYRNGVDPTGEVYPEELRAAKLLTKADFLPVKEVAILCGFEDANYFSKVFRRLYGTTPSQFRTTGMYASLGNHR